MDGGDIAATAAAYLALLVSGVSALLAARSAKETRRQADSAEQSLEAARQAGQSAAVIHFTSRFLDLIHDGMKFDDPAWARHFWGLQATEFYFFDNGWLPSFMYELWMVELVVEYRASPDVWRSHKDYLDRFAVNYSRMVEFFDGLADIATQSFETARQRNQKITGYVAGHAPGAASRP